MSALLWIGVAVFGLAGPASGLPQETPAPGRSPALTESINQAFQLIDEGKFKEARTELEKAQILAAGPCGECLLGMSHVYASEKDWTRTREAAQQALLLLPTPDLKARAYDEMGTAAFRTNDLDAAEAAFRHAVESGGSWGTLARYNLAQVFWTKKQWADAVAAARAYIKEAGPKGKVLDQARVVLCRARLNLAEGSTSPAGTSSAAESGIEKIGDQVTKPELLFRTRPAYPEEARKAKEQGKVIVEAVIDKEGCVIHVRPLQGLPHGLTESAVHAAQRWVFRPATRAGAPVKVAYVLTVNFEVQPGLPIVLPGTVP